MSLKNILRKSIATFGAITLMFSNFSLCGVGLSKVIAENMGAPAILAEITNERYVQYKKEELAAVAIHSNLSIYANQEQGKYLPTESAEVAVKLPEINGFLPERAIVAEAITKATTGEELNTKINQNYDSNSGLLTVSYQNIPNQEGNIYSEYKENAKDEFEIIYIYPAEAYTGNDEEIKLEYELNAKMNFKIENDIITSQFDQTIEISEKDNKGDIKSFRITELKANIYKGFMESNVKNKTNYDTEYNTVSTFAVINNQLVDEIEMELQESKFVLNDEEATEISADGNIIYKTTKISRYEFDKIIGQNGFVEIYDGEDVIAIVKYVETEDSKKIAVIYKDGNTEILEDDATTITINYPDNLSSLKIKMSKPIMEGFMHFENQNVIKAVEDYGCEIEGIKSIKTIGKVDGIEKITNIELSESKTQVDMSMDNTNLSILTPNNVTITATLRTDDIKYKLFENPVIEIELPDGIKKADLGDIQLVYGNDEIDIKNVELNDNKIIKIELEGNQKQYNIGTIQEGTSIVIPLYIEFYNTTPMQSTNLLLKVNNNGEETSSRLRLELLSKQGLMTVTNLYGYNGDNKVTLINNQQQDVLLEVAESKKIATMETALVNNSEEAITNIAVVGKVSESDDIKCILDKGLNVSKNVKVYYSEDINAGTTDDTWKEDVKDYSKIKSYMIVIDKLEAKEVFNFSYDFEIPKELEYNKETKVSYNIYNLRTRSTQSEEVGIILRTGSVPEIGLEVSPNISLDYIHEGQVVEYIIKVKNNSEQTVENIEIEDIISDNAIYTEYTPEDFDGNHAQGGFEPKEDVKNKKYTINKLNPNETKEISIFLKAVNIDAETAKLKNIVKANINLETTGELKTVNTITTETEVIKAKLDVEIKYMKQGNDVRETDQIKYYLYVKNNTNENIKNIKVEDILDKDIKYESIVDFNAQYNEQTGEKIEFIKNINVDENNTLTYEISKLEPNQMSSVLIIGTIINNTNYSEKVLKNRAKVFAKNIDAHESNTILYNLKGSKITVKMTSNAESKVIEEKSIIYNIGVKNEGNSSKNISLKDIFPEEYIIESAKVKYRENVEENSYIGNMFTYIGTIEADETLDIEIKVKTAKLDAGKIQEELNNIVYVYILDSMGNTINTLESNKITTIIEKEIEEDNNDNEQSGNENDNNNENGQPDDGNNNNNENKQPDNEGNNNNNEQLDNEKNDNVEKTYAIKGLAWVDTNKDGKRDTEDTLLSNIKVTVIDADTNKIVEKEDGTDYSVTILEDGSYTITDLKNGNYILAFEYDTNTYTVTTYKKNGVEEAVNSDVINKNITLLGEKKLVALTDKLVINEADIINVDIGLIKNPTFDLMLDKQISKITVINSQGTEEINYEEGTNTAKVDLVAKYINTSNVVVTYNFIITNNGEITGYVDSLVDDLPSGLEFSSDLNKDWYKGSDGKLYTTSLSGIAIKPGKSTEIELVLTKSMTEENMGLFSNNAELEKVSNLEGIKEKEEAKENNVSSADLFISIKTGSTILYIGITISCILIIAAGAYIIKRKILNKCI